MAKYTKIPENTFKELQLNAGMLLSNFAPETATVQDSDIMGATSGGANFTATPSYTDFGDDIDNCPKNMAELKKLESWDIKIAGTFVSAGKSLASSLIGPADVTSGNTGNPDKIVPRNDLKSTDFKDIWWVGDYSDVNVGDSAGFIAIHMMKTLSTGGFQIQSADKAKGTFAFEYTAHFSMSSQDTVPFEIYILGGTAAGMSENDSKAVAD